MEILLDMLVAVSGKDKEPCRKDVDRDYFMSAEEARDYGLIDKVLLPGER